MRDSARLSGMSDAALPRPRLFRRLREEIDCVFSRDPAARGRFEALTTYPGLHALLIHRLAHRLWCGHWRYLARWLSFVARALTQIDIHPGATIGRRLFIDHGCGVVIGETAEIGDDVTLYHGVTLGGVSASGGKRHPTLADGVLVGAGAKILGPITIGENARIGANSVVMENTPAGATVVGIPGKIVRGLETRRRLAGGRVDLEHHLMPDPVGEALAYLIDRVDFLEARLTEMQRARRAENEHA